MKLTAKLTVIILTIVMFFGMVLTTFVYRANLKTLEKDITDRFKDMTFHIMDKIDRSLYERYSNIQIIASDPIVSARTSTPEQITKRLIEYRNTFKTYSSLSFFDLNRIRIADISRLNIGKQHPMVGYWEDVLAGKISAASDIRVAEELHAPVIYFAAPVKDRSGHPFGVVVARVPVTRLYEITKKAGVIQEAEDLEIDLLDKQGLLLYSSQ